MLLSCDILDMAAAVLWVGIPLKVQAMTGCRQYRSVQVLLKANAVYTPMFWFLANQPSIKGLII